MNAPLFPRLDTVPISRTALAFRDPSALQAHLDVHQDVGPRPIGESRNRRPMYGYSLGRGPQSVSLIAGCHADEPAGPMTAQALPNLLRDGFPELLDAFTFHVVPQMNPDGAEANRPWFAVPPDFRAYLTHAVREGPGDDIEFAFAEDGRPENRAAMDFLKPHGPYAAHFSLHGMPFAEGVWWLIGRDWASRAEKFKDGLADYTQRRGFDLHDIDRKGEKGFHRLRPGFATTPHSAAMRQYFQDRGDEETAEKFRPSSMEYIAALGGHPLCMVTEVPLFLLQGQPTALDDPVFLRFRHAVADTLRQDGGTPGSAVDRLIGRYNVQPVPLAEQIRLQTAAIVLALHFLLAAQAPQTP